MIEIKNRWFLLGMLFLLFNLTLTGCKIPGFSNKLIEESLVAATQDSIVEFSPLFQAESMPQRQDGSTPDSQNKSIPQRQNENSPQKQTQSNGKSQTISISESQVVSIKSGSLDGIYNVWLGNSNGAKSSQLSLSISSSLNGILEGYVDFINSEMLSTDLSGDNKFDGRKFKVVFNVDENEMILNGEYDGVSKISGSVTGGNGDYSSSKYPYFYIENVRPQGSNSTPKGPDWSQDINLSNDQPDPYQDSEGSPAPQASQQNNTVAPAPQQNNTVAPAPQQNNTVAPAPQQSNNAAPAPSAPVLTEKYSTGYLTNTDKAGCYKISANLTLPEVTGIDNKGEAVYNFFGIAGSGNKDIYNIIDFGFGKDKDSSEWYVFANYGSGNKANQESAYRLVSSRNPGVQISKKDAAIVPVGGTVNYGLWSDFKNVLTVPVNTKVHMVLYVSAQDEITLDIMYGSVRKQIAYYFSGANIDGKGLAFRRESCIIAQGSNGNIAASTNVLWEDLYQYTRTATYGWVNKGKFYEDVTGVLPLNISLQQNLPYAETVVYGNRY